MDDKTGKHTDWIVGILAIAGIIAFIVYKVLTSGNCTSGF
jgi:hypothetical protein